MAYNVDYPKYIEDAARYMASLPSDADDDIIVEEREIDEWNGAADALTHVGAELFGISLARVMYDMQKAYDKERGELL